KTPGSRTGRQRRSGAQCATHDASPVGCPPSSPNRRKESAAMSLERPRVSTAVALAAGVVLGWILAVAPRPMLRAHGGDRWGDAILTSGPVMIRYDERLKAPLAHDALYYLDYRGGRLLATVPSYQQSGGSTRMIDTFAERDLVTDFKL